MSLAVSFCQKKICCSAFPVKRNYKTNGSSLCESPDEKSFIRPKFNKKDLRVVLMNLGSNPQRSPNKKPHNPLRQGFNDHVLCVVPTNECRIVAIEAMNVKSENFFPYCCICRERRSFLSASISSGQLRYTRHFPD